MRISSIPLPYQDVAGLANQRAQEGDSREKYHKDNCDIEHQLFDSASRFKSCARAWSTEGATQASAAYLEQNKQKNGHAQDNLNDANGRKPLLQNSSSLS